MTDKEKVAQWMIRQGYATGHGDTIEDLLKELEWQILENWHRAMVNSMKAERKACLKEIAIELDEWKHRTNANIALNNVYAAIQARSEK